MNLKVSVNWRHRSRLPLHLSWRTKERKRPSKSRTEAMWLNSSHKVRECNHPKLDSLAHNPLGSQTMHSHSIKFTNSNSPSKILEFLNLQTEIFYPWTLSLMIRSQHGFLVLLLKQEIQVLLCGLILLAVRILTTFRLTFNERRLMVLLWVTWRRVVLDSKHQVWGQP